MEKVSFGGVLCLEITRRCNLKCAHCMRGEAQEFDISNNIIDNLLFQTNEIEKVVFTGGEPFLALGKIKYFLEKVKENNIAVYGLEIITNGTCFSDEVIKIIQEYSNYIQKCFELKYNKSFSKEFKEKRVRIAISCDKYHDVNAIEVYKEYKNKLSSYAFLSLHTLGELVEAKGRGNRLNNAIKGEKFYPHRIEVFGNNRTCYCEAVTEYMDKHQPNDNVIMCSIDIDIMGNMKNIKCDEDCSEDIILNLATGDSILSGIEKYNENKTICIFANKIVNEKSQKRFKNYEFMHKWISNNLSKFDLEKKIKKEIKDYDDDPRYPIEKFYEYYGNSLEEIKREFEKYNVPREEFKIIADYKYKEFKNVYENYPTLTYNECKKLNDYLMNPKKYKNEIRKYKIIHYKRLFYIEMMKEVKDMLFTQTLFKHFEEMKNIDDDSLYDMFCACFPEKIVELITKETFMEINDEKEHVNKISCMVSVLTRKIKWIVENFDFEEDKEEQSKQVEDVLYRRLGILYCYKEFISYYRNELDFEKRDIIKKIDPYIDNFILMYEYILECPLLIMTIQNNTDSVNGRTLTYSAKDISIEKMSMLFDLDKIHKYVEVKEFYERYQLEMKQTANID